MVSVSIFAFLFVLFVRISSGFVLTSSLSGESLVDYVNSVQSLFKAEYRSDARAEYRVMDMKYSEPLEEHKLLLMKPRIDARAYDSSLPESFDARNKWPKCKSLKSIRNQGSCGSCWAFSTAELMSDRICIQSDGSRQPVISAQDILACSTENGCSGGWPMSALMFWNKTGVVTGDENNGGCEPYTASNNCVQTCRPGYPRNYTSDKTFGNHPYSLPRDIVQIQWDIYNHGPVSATFQVFADFFDYKSGVYKHTSGGSVGFHAVKIIGWGVENKTPFWVIANSWGVGFGERGFFRMIRGQNNCGIENSIVAATANSDDFDYVYSGSTRSLSTILTAILIVSFNFVVS